MKLYKHQEDALKQTEGKNKVAYYLDMGLGKTFVGAEKAMSLNKDILIVCQKSKIADWKKHFFKYYIDKMKCDESGAWCYDLTSNTGMDMFLHSRYRIRIGVINYELAWRRQTELLNLHDFTLMLDESSLIQNRKAKQTKFILKLKSDNVILLSGTPTSGRYENLWTQAHLLGWNIKEPLFLKHYTNTYFDKIIGHNVIDKKNPYKNIERLKNKFRSYGSVFMKTDEVFDLPEQNFINVTVPASKEYKKFMKDSIVTVDNVELVGDTSLTKLLYARQLCSIYNSDKLDAFKDLVDSTQDRLIVFYNFNAELEILLRNVTRPVSIVNGHTKDLTAYEERDDSITFIQYQAGAMGLNLQKANKIIYYSPTPRCEHWMQSLKRIHRIGQEKPCFYYKLVCGIEERIYKSLEQGVDFTDELFKED